MKRATILRPLWSGRLTAVATPRANQSEPLLHVPSTLWSPQVLNRNRSGAESVETVGPESVRSRNREPCMWQWVALGL